MINLSYTDASNKLSKAELLLLSILILSIPTAEAVKNISWILYTAIWIINRSPSHLKKITWDTWDTLFFLWILSGLVIASISNQGLQEWDGATDLIRYIGISWMVYRSNFSSKTTTWLISLVIVATIIALSHGYWNWLIANNKTALMLKSVGHVNHSAIYLAICAGLSTSLLIAFWKKANPLLLTLLFLSTIILIWSTLLTSARGAMIPLVVFFILANLLLRHYSKLLSTALALSLTLTITVAIQQDLPIVQKAKSIFTHNAIGLRDRTFNTGLLIWRNHPVAGVGLENFSYFSTSNKLKEMAIKYDGSYDPSKYISQSHAHNLYANSLAERGIVGTIPLLAIMLYWGFYLYRYRPTNQSTNIIIATWGGSLSAWVLSFIGGLFNTTLHHEHGILATLLLAFWLSSLRSTNSPPFHTQ